MSARPVVTFVVPCYQLAHYLRACVDSILAQSYANFEVLIMDDCSPDDTPAVAASFTDSRVRHVRHPHNVGHLRNYNDGIARARGEYVWLISADDWLRSPDVLERFVEVFDENPGVTLVFSQAMKVHNGRDVAAYPRRAPAGITDGQTFLDTSLLDYNCIPAASAMARRSAYLRAGGFPMDLPHSGDWFLWACFALYGEVAYVDEPLVNYRQHDGSMSRDFSANKVEAAIVNDLAVRWRIKRLAEQAKLPKVVAACRRTIAEEYVRRLVRPDDPANAFFSMTAAAVEASIAAFASTPAESATTRADVLEYRGDGARAAGTCSAARGFYRAALAVAPLRPKTWVKYAIARLDRDRAAARDTSAAVSAAGAAPTAGSSR